MNKNSKMRLVCIGNGMAGMRALEGVLARDGGPRGGLAPRVVAAPESAVWREVSFAPCRL